MFKMCRWLQSVVVALCILVVATSNAQLDGDRTEDDLVTPTLEKQLRDTISLWGGAWAAQIADAYFDFYSDRYIAPGFDSRQAWMADRRTRIEGPDYIRIRLLDFELIEIGELLAGQQIATTRFTLIYERPGYSDQTYKELELMNTGDGWKITSEENLRVERGSL